MNTPALDNHSFFLPITNVIIPVLCSHGQPFIFRLFTVIICVCFYMRSIWFDTYMIRSQGGRSRMWQKTWDSLSSPSATPDSCWICHSRRKWAIRKRSVDLWSRGSPSIRSDSVRVLGFSGIWNQFEKFLQRNQSWGGTHISFETGILSLFTWHGEQALLCQSDFVGHLPNFKNYKENTAPCHDLLD